MDKDLEIGVPRNSDLQLKSNATVVIPTNVTGGNQDRLPQQYAEKTNQPNEELLKLESNHQVSELRTQAGDPISAGNSSLSPEMENGVTEKTPNSVFKISETKEKATPDAKEFPSLDLSLKRLRSVGSTTRVERNVLRHSDMSAFSRCEEECPKTQETSLILRCRKIFINYTTMQVQCCCRYNPGCHRTWKKHFFSS